MPGIGFNAMKNSAVYNKKIPLLQTQSLPVQPCKAASLVNADDFHFFMPVVVKRAENHAVICISFHRQLKRTMGLQFLHGLVNIWGNFRFLLCHHDLLIVCAVVSIIRYRTGWCKPDTAGENNFEKQRLVLEKTPQWFIMRLQES